MWQSTLPVVPQTPPFFSLNPKDGNACVNNFPRHFAIQISLQRRSRKSALPIYWLLRLWLTQIDSPLFLRHSVLPLILTLSGIIFSSFPTLSSWPLSHTIVSLPKKLSILPYLISISLSSSTMVKMAFIWIERVEKVLHSRAISLTIPYCCLLSTNMPYSRFPKVVEIHHVYSL